MTALPDLHNDIDASALVLTRVFDAPPAQVFGLWSDPEHVKEWWHPKDFTTPVFEMDFREGGAYRYCIHSNGRDGWAHGTYKTIEAPHRLVFTFQWESGDATHDAETLITLSFEAQGDDQTVMTFRQAPFASTSARDSHGAGWGQVLDAFDQALAGVRT
ncbi:MAG: SRPBCC domain-containing protein [Caldimonas sp.]